ncbi:MAG: hypothetical protein V3T86_04740 [Planctomycetota bacterium]
MSLWFGYVAARAGRTPWLWAGIGFLGGLLIDALAAPFGSTFYGRVGIEDEFSWYERRFLPHVFRMVACAAAAILFLIRSPTTVAAPRAFEATRNYAALFHRPGAGPNVAILPALALGLYLNPYASHLTNETALVYLAICLLYSLAFFVLHTGTRSNTLIVLG